MGIVKVVLKTVAVLAVLLVAFILFAGYGMAQEGRSGAGDTWDIIVPSSTGIGGKTVLEIYDPGPGRRLQLRNPEFMNNEILGYIDKRTGTITGPDSRREIGRLESLFAK